MGLDKVYADLQAAVAEAVAAMTEQRGRGYASDKESWADLTKRVEECDDLLKNVKKSPEGHVENPEIRTYTEAQLRRLWSEGLTDTEIAAQLGIPVVRFAKWRQRVGLLRPRTAQTRREDTTKKPAQAGGVQEEQSMKKQNVDAQETCRTAAPGAVTVKGLRVLLDAAEAAGYGDVPLEVKGCRLAEMHLRVETLIGAEAPGTLVELMATPAEV